MGSISEKAAEMEKEIGPSEMDAAAALKRTGDLPYGRKSGNRHFEWMMKCDVKRSP